MIIIPVIGLAVGIILGILCPYIFPSGYSGYIAIGILACADTVLGGVRSILKDKFDVAIFMTGFFSNAVLATLLVFLGEQLNIQLSIAAVVVFGSRIFNNFSSIRRDLLNKGEKGTNNNT
ncbi:small basic family protein [Anaerotignum faecicola]